MQDYSQKGKIGDDISFETIGVIGTGRIGTTVIRHLSGFGAYCTVTGMIFIWFILARVYGGLLHFTLRRKSI